MSTNATEPHDVAAAVVALLEGIDGSGSYNYDVGGRVFVGMPTDPMSASRPVLYVDGGELRTVESSVLGGWRHTLTLRVVGYVDAASTASNIASTGSIACAWKLFADVKRTLYGKANQSLPTGGNPSGLVHLFRPEEDVFPGVKGPYADDLGNGIGSFIAAFSYQWDQVFP